MVGVWLVVVAVGGGWWRLLVVAGGCWWLLLLVLGRGDDGVDDEE